MKNLTRNLTVATLSLALVGLSTLPASAVTFNGGGVTIGDLTNGTYWVLDDRNGATGHSRMYVDGAEFLQVVHYSGHLSIDGQEMSYSTDFDLSTDGNGDQVMIGVGTFGSLDVTAEYRAYAEGDLLRQTWVMTNNTRSSVTVTPSVYEDISDFFSESGTTSSGDILLTTADYWYTQFDSRFVNGDTTVGQTVVYSKFWGSPDHTRLTSVSPDLVLTDYGDGRVEFTDITIKPGASFQWVTFHSMATYDISGDEAATDLAAIAAGEAAVAEFGDSDPTLSGSARLTRELDLTIPSNWFSGGVSEELAPTGGDDIALLTLFASIGLFAASVAVRQRRAMRS